MKHIHEVLRQKEIDLVRVRREVEALRCVAPLLVERDDQPGLHLETSRPEPARKNRWPLELEDLTRTSPP